MKETSLGNVTFVKSRESRDASPVIEKHKVVNISDPACDSDCSQSCGTGGDCAASCGGGGPDCACGSNSCGCGIK